MDQHQEMVQDFHEKFGSTVGTFPELRDRELRAKLILEEAVETVAAMGFTVDAQLFHNDNFAEPIALLTKTFPKPDFVEVIDGLADLEYVLKGAAVTFGIDLEPFFAEVHRSNMDKEGGRTREDGKVLKPEGWQPPDIDRILIRQQNAADMWRQLEQEALDDNDSPIEVINAADEAVA